MVKTVGKYHFIRTLGEGEFGKVKHAVNGQTKEEVAIKVIIVERISKDLVLQNQLKKEIGILKQLKHKNIVRLQEVLASKEKIYMVMELLTGGEVYAKLLLYKRFSERVSGTYFAQLVSGLKYCHNNKVFHRDLKPENLLLDNKGNLKIADFGLAGYTNDPNRLLYTRCGTTQYAAPEVLGDDPYDGAKSDIWSCGVILFVFLTGSLPFNDTNPTELVRKIKNVDFTFPDYFPPGPKDIVNKILVPDPKKRIDIKTLREHLWVRRYRGLDDSFNSFTELEFFEGTNEKIENESKDNLTPQESVEFDIVEERNDKSIWPSPGSDSEDISTLKITNAFLLVSLSGAFDLSPLLYPHPIKSFSKFTSKQDIKVIFDVLTNAFKVMGLNFEQKPRKILEVSTQGGELKVVVQVYSVPGGTFITDVRRKKGDPLEFTHLYRRLVELCEPIIEEDLAKEHTESVISSASLENTPPSSPSKLRTPKPWGSGDFTKNSLRRSAGNDHTRSPRTNNTLSSSASGFSSTSPPSPSKNLFSFFSK